MIFILDFNKSRAGEAGEASPIVGLGYLNTKRFAPFSCRVEPGGKNSCILLENLRGAI